MFYCMIINFGVGILDLVYGLYGIWLFVGIVFNFIIGVLMIMGLGNYVFEFIFFFLMGLSFVVVMFVMMLDVVMIMIVFSI